MNSSLKPISIIFPFHNHVRYVVQALRSIFEQTHPDLEVIIIDAGSNDGSLEVVQAFLKTYISPPRIKREISFLTLRDKSFQAIVNQSISLAKHDFIALLNPDDSYASDRLLIMQKEMMRDQVHLAFSEVIPIDGEGRLLPVLDPWMKSYHSTLIDLIQLPSISCGFLMSNLAITAGNLLFTRDLYERVGPFKEDQDFYDYDFILKAILVDEPIFIRKGLYFKRIQSGNSNSQEDLARIISTFLKTITDNKHQNRLAPSPWNFPTDFAEARNLSKIDRYLSHYLETPSSDFVTEARDHHKMAAVQGENSKPKVTLITHQLSFSGAPMVAYELSLVLKKRGYRPSMISLSEGPLRRLLEEQGIPVSIVPHLFQAAKQTAFLKKIIAMVGLYFYLFAKTSRTVILNSFVTMDAGFVIAFIPFLKRFWYIHESVPPSILIPRTFRSRAMNILRNGSTFRFLFGSKNTQELWQRSGVEGHHAYWSGIPSQDNRTNFPRPIKNILAIGSIEMRKGIHVLVDAFIQCIRRQEIGENVTLTIIGFPEEIKYSYQGDIVLRVLNENMQDRIRLLKIVPVDQIDHFFDQADLFVLSSSNECLPLVLLKAMSKGLPIISTNVYGCEEAIEHGVTGYLCAPQNPDLLARLITKTVNHPEQAWKMGENALKSFNEKFSLEQNAQEFYDHFSKS